MALSGTMRYAHLTKNHRLGEVTYSSRHLQIPHGVLAAKGQLAKASLHGEFYDIVTKTITSTFTLVTTTTCFIQMKFYETLSISLFIINLPTHQIYLCVTVLNENETPFKLPLRQVMCFIPSVNICHTKFSRTKIRYIQDSCAH